MKSKMKLAFALIAVALMVMVAVVPMVSVFTDATATVVSDPAKAKDTNFTVSVAVKNAAGAADTSAYVKITYGSSTQIASAKGSATFTIYEKTVSSMTITYGTATGVADTSYGSVTLSSLKAGETYGATLQQGKATATLTIVDKGGNALSSYFTTLSGTYEVYSTQDTATAVKLGSGQLTANADYTATISYTYSATAYVYVQTLTSNLTLTPTTTATATTWIDVSSGTANIPVEQSIVTISTNGMDAAFGKMTVSAFTVAGTAASPVMQIIDNTLGYNSETAKVFGVLNTSGTDTVSMTLTADGSSFTYTQSTGVLGTSLVWTVSNAFFGKIAMATSYIQAGTLSANICDATSTLGTISGVTVDASGYFFKFLPTITGTPTKYDSVSFVSNGTTFASTLDFPTYGADDITGTVPDTGYSLVSGNMYLGAATATAKGVVGATLSINGAKTFGPLTTGDAGAFAFYAETGKTISISVPGVTITGDISIIPNAGSTGKVLVMPTQKIELKTTNALGKEIAVTTAYLKQVVGTVSVPVMTTATNGQFEVGTTTGSYYANVRADVDATKYFVYFTAAGSYTFDANSDETKVAYVKDGTYAANNAEFTLEMLDSAGNVITPAASTVKIVAAKAFKNTEGAIIYQYDSGDVVDLGATFKFYQKLVPMQKKASDLSATPITVVIAMAGTATTWGDNNFDTYCILTTDAKGKVVIQGNDDSTVGKVTRGDGKTGIAGVTVNLYSTSGFTKLLCTTTSDDEGKFTVTSDYKITTTNYLTFVKDGYTFTAAGYAVVLPTTATPVPAYVSTADSYELTIVDADGADFTPSTTYTLSVGGTAAVAGITTYSLTKAIAADDSLAVTLKSTGEGTPNVRTFADYKVTEEDVASGEITLITKQESYTVEKYDADLKALTKGTPALYTLKNGAVSGAPVAVDGLIGKIDATKSSYTFPATVLTDGSEYVIRMTNADGYTFSEDYYEFEDGVAAVVSDCGKLSFQLADAEGNILSVNQTLTDGKVAPKEKTAATAAGTIAVTKDLVNNKLTFVGDSSLDYYPVTGFTLGVYHFANDEAIDDGVLYANEETVVYTFTDALGTPITVADGFKISYYATKTAETATVLEPVAVPDGNGEFITVADISKVYGYAIEDNTVGGAIFTFADQDGPVFVANESVIVPSFVTANGCSIKANDDIFDSVSAYGGSAVPIATMEYGVDECLIVDMAKVSYYEVEVTNDCPYSFETSILPIFVANESAITGAVPYSGDETAIQDLVLDLYLGDNLVGKVDDNILVAGYEYSAIIDLSGMIVGTAGVMFDSIVAVYSENGVVIASAPIDPYTAVNNIVSPVEEIYVAELLPPSALVASHVDIEQIGVTVTVTADSNFMIADDEGVYTDGQYTYTFAGWYVNNQKVSTSPVYTFELNDNVVISPQYTVTYEKTSDANDKQTPQPQPVQPDNSIDTNVLIIGICAVIVALIAVVYAVIKKE